MKKQVKDWILLADQDLYASELLIKNEQPLTNIVAFHCQQTIEKYLKAFYDMLCAVMINPTTSLGDILIF